MSATDKLTLDGVPFNTEDPSGVANEGVRRRFGIKVPQPDMGVTRPCG